MSVFFCSRGNVIITKDKVHGKVETLGEKFRGKSGEWYKGTANSIFQNIAFIEQYDPDYVLVLSGDHIYKMDYRLMLNDHIEHRADVTIAVRPVPWEEAPAFGIMSVDGENRITEFEEKPARPKSNLASMGVYVFSWPVLKKYLTEDDADPDSKNDFGKNIIPKILADGLRLQAYSFEAYWKDVGTIASLWEANMDLLKIPPEFNLSDSRWPVYARSPVLPPHFIGDDAEVEGSMIAEGCEVDGAVKNSVLFYGVEIAKGAVVEDSVIMPNTRIESGAVIRRAIVAENCVVGENCAVGAVDGDIALVGQDTVLPAGFTVGAGEQVDAQEVAKREADAK